MASNHKKSLFDSLFPSSILQDPSARSHTALPRCGANRWLCQSLSLTAISEIVLPRHTSPDRTISHERAGKRTTANTRDHAPNEGRRPQQKTPRRHAFPRLLILDYNLSLILSPPSSRDAKTHFSIPPIKHTTWCRLTMCHRGTGHVVITLLLDLPPILQGCRSIQ